MENKKKKNKRQATKYPGLKQNTNLPSRKELIDFDYLDKLGESELEFLNKFVEETVVTNFSHHPDIKKLIGIRKRIIEDESVMKLKSQVKELNTDKSKNGPEIKRLKAIITLLKKQNEETYADKLELIESDLQDLRDEHLLYPNKDDHKSFYNANNSRNVCILTRKKTERRLDELDVDRHDHVEMTEEDLIDQIERRKWEEEEERLLKVEKELKKSK